MYRNCSFILQNMNWLIWQCRCDMPTLQMTITEIQFAIQMLCYNMLTLHCIIKYCAAALLVFFRQHQNCRKLECVALFSDCVSTVRPKASVLVCARRVSTVTSSAWSCLISSSSALTKTLGQSGPEEWLLIKASGELSAADHFIKLAVITPALKTF